MNTSRQHTDQHDERRAQIDEHWRRPIPVHDRPISLRVVFALILVGAIGGAFWATIAFMALGWM